MHTSRDLNTAFLGLEMGQKMRHPYGLINVLGKLNGVGNRKECKKDHPFCPIVDVMEQIKGMLLSWVILSYLLHPIEWLPLQFSKFSPCIAPQAPLDHYHHYLSLCSGFIDLSVHLRSHNPFDNEYAFYSKGLPVILSFSEIISDLVVKVSSKPELARLNDVHWVSLSSIHGPSKTWVTEFPLQGYPEAEYAISLEISSPGVICEDLEIKFNLHVSAGWVTREADSSAARKTSKGSFLWPAKISTDGHTGERRHKLEGGGAMLSSVELGKGEPVLSGNPVSEDAKKKTVNATISKVCWQQRALEEQIQNLRELLGLEQHIKWAKLTLARVLLAHSALTHNYGQCTNEILDLLKELMQLDPVHSDFYKSLLSTIFIAKVLQNPTSMKQLWWDSPSVDSEHVETAGWLRWNGLSLNKFDSVERMLWVQRLDLSHNQLRTVEGLEALQLLVALDVSYNLIPHVTSLAALHLNPGLRYLNISHNEIGSHPVDSSRYSFPSFLTNDIKLSSSKDGLGEDEIAEDQWEIQAIFGGMSLSIFEISDNYIVNNKAFIESLVRALPSLELLDGNQLP